MKGMKAAAMLAASLVLAGCKTTVNSEVSASELLSGASRELPGDLYVEVPACNDFEDSRKPSKTLLDVQQKVPGIFPQAAFKECFKQKLTSYVHFSMPLFLDRDKDGKAGSEKTINIIANDSVVMGLSLPAAIQKKITRAKKGVPGTLDLSVQVKVTNDTKEPFRFIVEGAYIDDTPTVDRILTAPPGASFTVKLADVSVDAAVNGSDAPVLKNAPPKS